MDRMYSIGEDDRSHNNAALFVRPDSRLIEIGLDSFSSSTVQVPYLRRDKKRLLENWWQDSGRDWN
jgi:hypothetical protein